MTQNSENRSPGHQYPYPFAEFLQDTNALDAAGPAINTSKDGAIAFLTKHHQARSSDPAEIAFKVARFIAILDFIGEHMNKVAIGDVSPRDPEDVFAEILRHSFQAVHEAYAITPPDPAHPLDSASLWARVRQLGEAARSEGDI